MGDANGNANEKPIHSVTLSSFYISKYEVTVAEFKQFVDATHYTTDAEKDGWSYIFANGNWVKQNGASWRTDPAGQTVPADSMDKAVVNVSWNDAVKYCEWKSPATGRALTLPTEAQWEYAARGGSLSRGYPYSGGANAAEVGWVIANSGKNTHPVGRLKPNELGLYDMTGNAYEWCSDWYAGYTADPATNPQGPVAGAARVLRGGSWYYTSKDVEVFIRGNRAPGYHSSSVGFRVACAL
jgi:formylglycine-generating enzyme required for sulfatase activity